GPHLERWRLLGGGDRWGLARHDPVEDQGSAFHNAAPGPDDRGNGCLDNDLEKRLDQLRRQGSAPDSSVHTGVCDQFWSSVAPSAGRTPRGISGTTALGLELIFAGLLRYIGPAETRGLETRLNTPPCCRRFFRETLPDNAWSCSRPSTFQCNQL